MDFFILGNPRSGTTLLRLMLNSHHLIGVPPESGFLHWWYSKYSDWSVENTKNDSLLDLFLEDLLSSKKIENWEINRTELKAFIIKSLPENYIEIIDCIYYFYCKNKSIIGDKNNYYINHLEEISFIVPNAKYIHIIRDGRDIACSYKKISKLDQKIKYIPKISSNIGEIANEWNQNITNIEKFIQGQNSLTIRYEDLISNPKEVLSQVCSFLNVPFEEDMLNFHLSSMNDEPIASMPWKSKTLETIDASNQRKYLKILSKEEINIFNTIAVKNLNKFNYE